MLAMRFSQILMQHYAMTNRKTAVHAVYQQENQPSQPNPQPQKKNNPTAMQDNAGVRRALIRFVNDVKLVRDAGNKSSPPSAG